jgi:hypothetical protein
VQLGEGVKMAIYVPDEGAASFLANSLNNSFPAGGANLTLKLFCNNITLSDTDTTTTFTEAAGGGYSAKTLIAGSWVDSVVGGIAQSAYPTQTFTFTGLLTTNAIIYGYYVVDADATLKFAELFTEGVEPTDDGNYINITIIFKGSKGGPS